MAEEVGIEFAAIMFILSTGERVWLKSSASFNKSAMSDNLLEEGELGDMVETTDKKTDYRRLRLAQSATL